MIDQYGVLAWKRGAEGEPRVLLITSRETKRWVIPRGNAMPGLAPHACAAEEAWEEAGVRGAVSVRALGGYRYQKRRRDGSLTPAHVRVFPLAVEEEQEDWPESSQRERRWFAKPDAAAAVHEEELGALILGFAPPDAADTEPSHQAGKAQVPPLEAEMDGSEIMRSLLDALPEPALIVAGGQVRIGNEAARHVLGTAIEGEDVRRAVPHPAAVERLLGTAGDADDEVELAGIGEADRRWMMSVAPLGDGALFVRLIDRSEAHAAEKMRVDFVANASHELRTPLATLVGYAETLREQSEEIDPPTRERFIAIVHDEARRMQRLVEDLISLSRIEAERFSTPKDPLRLDSLAEEARASCRGLAAERASELRIEAEAGLPAVTGDRNELLQLLDNLIGNALRYGRHGAPVSIRMRRESEMVRLTVSDEGDGIAAEHIPRITERFYRVDPSRSRSLAGTGLGLSIVKHIVERHRGRLHIESEPGRGTDVHVLLPVAAP